MKRITQNEAILSALKRGEKLTQLDALRRFGCFRLASRINDLKNDGHIIKSEPHAWKTELGENKTIAIYSMDVEKKQGEFAL